MIACPPSNDTDQSVQRHRLISAVALRSVGNQSSKYSLKGRQKFCLECVNAKAVLSLAGRTFNLVESAVP